MLKKILVRRRQEIFEKTQFRVSKTVLAAQLGVSRQGLYKQIKSLEEDFQLRKFIRKRVYELRSEMPRIGGRKILHILRPEFQELHINCGRDKLFKILRQEGLLVRKKKNVHKTTRRYKRFREHPNQIMDLELNKPEQVFVSDITYIGARKKHLYLSLVTDAYSKKIMGYHISEDLKTRSVMKALKMAINNRIYPTRKLIHHSDRGFQYCSDAFTQMLKDHKIEISMTTKYDPYENAIAERVNGILKDEFYIDDRRLEKNETIRLINKSIKTYNERRPHMSIHYLTPNEAHKKGGYKLVTWKK